MGEFDKRRRARIHPAKTEAVKWRVTNARLRAKIAHFQNERETLARFITATNRAPSRAERLALVIADVNEIFQARATALYLYTATGAHTRDAHFVDYPDADTARQITLAQAPQTLPIEATLLATGQPVFAILATDDTARPSPNADESWPTLVLPLWYEGRINGCIYLCRAMRDAPFTPADAAFGGNFAAVTGLIIERIEYEARMLRRASRAEAVREIGRQLSAELDFERFLDSAGTQLMTLMNVRDFLLTAWNEAAQELTTLLYIGDGLLQDWHPTIRPTERRGLTSIVASERRTVHVPDYLEECRRQGIVPVTPDGDWSALAWVGVPLLAQGRLIGVIVVERHGQHFDVEEVALLEALAGQIAAAMENVRLYAEVRQLAISDPLTGLTNHRHLHACLNQELEQAVRYGHPLTLVMLDLNNFKRYNDTACCKKGSMARCVARKVCASRLCAPAP